ncbi:B12-binding domain-containing radical SAM protein [candidate division CSSED10-310 bacterium]|uniref:B12-binding domain-containing radical SAM protein n=1 Tax=candidate division CSSED10-310 bacterium TaxID=2855610 RepID=A0ABV6Z2R5_UNCC1
MNIVLISPYSDITSLGIRHLASVLKRDGFVVRLLFIPESRPEFHDLGDSWGDDEAAVIHETFTMVRESDVIGLSLMSNYLMRSVRLTQGLKKQLSPRTLFVWGGIHPTIRPQESLHYADGVCRGEGELAFAELASLMADDKDYLSTANFWFNHGKQLLRNPVRPLLKDLNQLPFPDYSLDDDYIFSYAEGTYRRMDETLLAQHLAQGYISGIRHKIAYQTIATRGCPHNCTYCCNNSLRELYTSKNYLRRRSIDHIITELVTMKEHFSFIEEIGFSDDSFFAAPLKEIEDFARLYQEKINKPFFCLGSPNTITADKMKALTQAGLYGLQMGIQTGSTRTQQLYKRTVKNEKILSAAKILNSFKGSLIPPTYDIIIDNPYESVTDYQETFALLLQLPRPHRIQIFSLVLFPETELHEKAVHDGLIMEHDELAPIKEYHHRRGTFINLVFALFGHGYPRPLLVFLTYRPILFLFCLPAFDYFFEKCYLLYKKLKKRIRNQDTVIQS